MENFVDWSQWSRDAVVAVTSSNERWRSKFGLGSARYRWDLDRCQILFETENRSVLATICLVGTASEADRKFIWGWANDLLPPAVTANLDAVRRFGKIHDLALVTTGELVGGIAQGKECVAIAARILEAEGAFIDHVDDVTLFFTLSNFRDVEHPIC